jgi:hypothetical protein
MAPTFFNAGDRESILSRLAQLSPDARPKWGKLDAPRMVTHVTDAVRASLGELALRPISSPIGYWPINVLVMFYLPWPKSAPTAPELLDRSPAAWADELVTLRATLDRFIARDVNGEWTRHVAFGSISGQQWGRLTYRHLDHHLTQFGV